MSVTVRSRKFVHNPLLQRKQMIIDVIHPKIPPVSRANLRKQIVTMYNVKDEQCVILFGFKTKFGGGQSTGFCLIYDNISALKQFEPKYRQIREGHMTKVQSSNKLKKQRKNRNLKLTAKEKNKAAREKASK